MVIEIGKMHDEAIKRMKMLKLNEEVINDFKKHGNVWVSEYQTPQLPAVLYCIDLNKGFAYCDKLDRAIRDFENEYNCVVYHVIIDRVGWTNFLYVSRHEDEWCYDHEDIENGRAMAFVKGYEDELGSIGICPVMGGVGRTW